MRGRAPHQITRREVTALDKYPTATIREIASEIGCSKTSVHRYLVMLGSIKQWPSLDRATDPNGAKCPRCEILLSEAPQGTGGECLYCEQECAYIERLKENAARVPGFVIDLAPLVLVEVGA
jgi:hypothetical protein